MQTRASNSKAHSGKALEALRVRRTKEVVQKEKEERKVKKEAKEMNRLAKDARMDVGREYVAQLEAEIAAGAVEDKSKYPRHQVQSKPSKRKAQSLEGDEDQPLRIDLLDKNKREKRRKNISGVLNKPDQVVTKRAVLKTGRSEEEVPTDTEDVNPFQGIDTTTNPGIENKVFQRNETRLEFELLKEASQDRRTVVMPSSPARSDNDVEMEDDATPRPRRADNRVCVESESDSESDPESEPFRTPSVLVRRKKHCYIEVTDEDTDGEKKADKREKQKVVTKSNKDSKNNKIARNPAFLKRLDTMGGKFRAASGKGEEKASHSSAPAMPTSIQTIANNKGPLSHSKVVPTSSDPTGHMDFPAQKAISKGKPDGFTMRTMSSNLDVVSKKIGDTLPPKTRIGAQPAKNVTKPGMQSDEDDSLERQVAMSSPMKGGEYRNTVKALVKTKEVTRKQRAAVDCLPLGATSEDAWTRVVIPTFINVMLSGDKPWASCEADIAPILQNVWNHTYGSKVPFKIQKGTAYQKLCQYRNYLATKAISVIYGYFQVKHADEEFEDDEFEDAIAKFADTLLNNNNFIYKGAENLAKPKRTGTLQHCLIIQTFSAHFSKLTVSPAPPPKGITIGKPYCALALTVAAVERALQLYSKHKITVNFGKTLQGTKFSVSKTLNPDTSKESGIATDFSFVVWGEITADYLLSAKRLDKQQFQQIFDAALRSVTHSSGKYEKAINSAADKHLKSHRAQLHSESDSEDGGGVDADHDGGIGISSGRRKQNDDGSGSEEHADPVDHGYNDW